MPYIRCFKCGTNSGYFHSYGGYHLCHECYEKPSDFCHRHLVAEWLTKNGYECKEFEFK